MTEEQKIKLESGKPLLIQGGVKITKNARTGQLEGVPEEWADSKIALPYSIDSRKVQRNAKYLPCQVRPDEELPESILFLINSKCPSSKSM